MSGVKSGYHLRSPDPLWLICPPGVVMQVTQCIESLVQELGHVALADAGS